MITKFSIFNFSRKAGSRSARQFSISLFVIIFIAIFLRFYNLSSVPLSASLDEVSIGWNAYSILKTGGDEYGAKFPLLLRAYDDWRPALYVYLVAPFVAIFDLNVLAVRLPSVILSVLTVIATYFLVKEILRDRSSPFWQARNERVQNGEIVALITAFLLAISPWHIYISRLGHEVNLGLTFLFFGILFFFKAKNFNTVQYYSKKIYLFLSLSSIFFSLSLVSYQAEKIVIPVILVGLVFIFRKELLVIKKQVVIALFVGFVIILPFVVETLRPNALIRFSATSIFNHQNERYEKQAELFAKAVQENDFIGKIVYNRRLVPVQIFSEGYISHFNPAWLFTNSSSDRHKVPNLGLLYLFEAPLILFGLIFLFSKQFNHKIRAFVLLWILVSPLPGAITTDAPHAMRAYTMLPMPQILAAIGAVLVAAKIFPRSGIWLRQTKIPFDSAQGGQIKYLIFTLFILFSVSNFLSFLHNYFKVFPKEQSASFQFALAEAIPFVLQLEREYNKVVFSNQDNLYQSYMFFLFYSKYDPKVYQSQGGTLSGGFAETHSFGKYEFRPIVWSEEQKRRKALYVGNPSDFPQQQQALFTGYYLDNKSGVKVAEIH